VIGEVAACLPVYRTYVQPERATCADSRAIDAVFEAARAHRSDLPEDLFDFFRDLLLLRIRGAPGGPEEELVMRFQQLTGPVMAKGVEDTAFYHFNRLVSLNEVGGDPSRFGTSLEDFHRACHDAQERWPTSMTATATHDTKRGEDVRLRIHLLSEIPDRWAEAVRRWFAHNERHRVGGVPDPNTEYLLYQTLVGAWPIAAERLTAYMEKTAREAKQFTSWTHIDATWEAGLRRYVEAVLSDDEFTADLDAFVAPLVEPARISSLAQTLIRCTAPGVPDTYQGSELWDLSLVDPDNRRPVDFAVRRRLLADLKTGLAPEEILARMDEGLPKLWVLHKALDLRRRLPEAFGPQGGYEPIAVQGTKAGHVVAFLRGGQAVTVAPRLLIGLGGDWQDTVVSLPVGPWRHELTGETLDGGSVRVDRLLRRFPAALLSRSQSPSQS